MRDLDLEAKDNCFVHERPNKSQLKREAQAMQDLAKALLELHEPVWSSLGLSDSVLEELKALKQIHQYGAKKRQLKRVAKLLRKQDVSSVRQMVENAQMRHVDAHARFHKIERWRDRLISGTKKDMADFCNDYPWVDSQALNQLVRNAKQELARGKPPKAAKQLFKWLREVMHQ